jgi:hypothetical protein
MKVPPTLTAFAAFVTLFFAPNERIGAALTAQEPQVMDINSEPLKVALSKIAPLEQWEVSQSRTGPRFCWTLFRAKPEQLEELWRTIGSFRGQTQWHLVDNCLEPGVGLLRAPGQHLLSPSTAPPPATQMNKADINRDLAALGNEIEMRLDLQRAKPMPFSEEQLTKEGLRKSRGPFEDFADGGQRTVYLIVKPTSELFEATKSDIRLHFEPQDDEMTAIFVDIVGADLTKRDFPALTAAEAEKVEKAFPVLWKIRDYYDGAYLTAEEAQALSRECNALDRIVSSPRALRGLDKLIRIANWASTKHYGVFFAPL